MRWIIILIVIAGIAWIASILPSILPIELTKRLDNIPAKILMSFLIFCLGLNVLILVYKLVYIPGNRRIYWIVIQSFLGVMIGVLLLPTGWAFIKTMKFRADKQRWVLDFQAADPSLPWASVVIAGIMATYIYAMLLMLSREPSDKPDESERHDRDAHKSA